MNKTLKWILIGLGILAGLAIIAMVVMRGFGFHPYLADGRFGGGYFMHRGGMMFGMGLMMLFRFLVPAGVLALAVVGVIALVRGRKPAPGTPVSAPVEAVKNCPKCGQPVQADWIHCAHCGKKQ